METKKFAILQHEAQWALDFLALSRETESGVTDLKTRLHKMALDPNQAVMELTADEVRLCVDGYEFQSPVQYVKGKPFGKRPTKDPTSTRFSADQAKLYARMKAFLRRPGEPTP